MTTVFLALAVAALAFLALPLVAATLLAREARCGSLMAEDARALGLAGAPALRKPTGADRSVLTGFHAADAGRIARVDE